MPAQTVSFHLSSATATDHGNSRYSVDLAPELDIGHTAEPTVYLHNLCFTNTFANVSAALYDNAALALTGSGVTGATTSTTISLADGAYGLADLELQIARGLKEIMVPNATPGQPDISAWARLKDVLNADLTSGSTYGSAAMSTAFVETTTDDGPSATITNRMAQEKQWQMQLADPDNAEEWRQALSIDQIKNFKYNFPVIPGYLPTLTSVDVDPETHVFYRFYVKPLTLAADNSSNRVKAVWVSETLAANVASSPLWTKLLGFSTENIASMTFYTEHDATSPARIDRVRACSFHCPSLASGTYGTDGKQGGSQLAMVPITADIGDVQSWEVSVPIRVPCSIAGSIKNRLEFFLSNEDGDVIDLLGERLEAVVVLEWNAP